MNKKNEKDINRLDEKYVIILYAIIMIGSIAIAPYEGTWIPIATASYLSLCDLLALASLFAFKPKTKNKFYNAFEVVGRFHLWSSNWMRF
jgi:hypothetical protein